MATIMNEKEKAPTDVAYDSNGSPGGSDHDFEAGGPNEPAKLSRSLKGRHMQMIAIGMLRMLRALYRI